MTTKPNEPEALEPCPFCGTEMELAHDHTTEDIDQIIHKTAQPYCPIYGSSGFGIGNENLVAAWNRRATAHPVADAGGVTDADREAYLAMNMLPEFDAADVRAGLWDKVTGVQAFARHRLQSVAAATAAKDAEIAILRLELEKSEALQDGAYKAGLAAGWNFAHSDDESGFQRARSSTEHVAELKRIRAALSEAREAGALADDSAPS